MPSPSDHDSTSAERQVARARWSTGKWLTLGGIGIGLTGAVVAILLTGGDDDDDSRPSADKPKPQLAPKHAPAPPPQRKARPDPNEPKPIKAHRGTITRMVGTLRPKNFDITASLATAQRIARVQFEDAQLIEIEADNVAADGTADLTMGRTSIVMYRFRSKARSDKTNGGVDDVGRRFCLYDVYVGKARYYHQPKDAHDCTAALIGPPRCSVTQVWEKARKRGVPADLKLARVHYKSVRTGKHKTRAAWIFSSGTKLELKLPDDCKK